MATILTGKSWRDFLDKNTHLPAAFDREHAAHDISSPVCINLKAVQGVIKEDEQENVEYQVSVCLYDTTYKQFFGRPWKGPSVTATRGNKLQYNKNVYFHTSAGTSSVVLVLEVQANTVGRDGRPRRSACGWGIIRPFGYEASDMPDSSRGIQPATQRIHLYHGSPRALYFMEEPIEANQLLKTVQGCTLTCAVMAHKALMRVMSLLPDNTLVDSNDIIPGIVDGVDGDRFKKPHLQRKVPIYIEGLVIQLQPNVDKFEDKLCELMRADRALRENRQEDTTDVIIQERRLQVGVHNGWCYLDKPVVFHLDKQSGRGTEAGRKPTASPSLRRSSMYHIRRNSTGSSSAGDGSNMMLVLKNRIQIDALLEDPMCAVVFTLEYIVGEPLSAQDRKQSMSLTRAHTRSLTVRWASWSPLLHPNTPEVTAALLGGPCRSPDDALTYKLPATNMQHESTAMSAGGLIAFRWARDGESIQHGMPSSLMVPPYNQIGSAGSLRSEVSDGMLIESSASGDMLKLKPPMGKHSPRSPRNQRGLQASPQQVQDMRRPGSAAISGYPHHLQAVGAAPATGAPAPVTGNMPYNMPQGYGYPMGPMGITAAQQQFMPMGSVYPGMYAPPTGLMPIDVMHVQETAASSELKDLPYTPVHALVLAQGPGTKGGRGLSRAAYARLYAAGFSPLKDRNGEPPEVIDPHGQHLINVAREQADPLQANEIIFQFLAYSKEPPSAGGASSVDIQAQASTVYFTFQFYRFPQVTTERMLLSKAQNDLSANPQAMPFILQRLNSDGSIMDCPPGLEVKYPIDPTYLKPGEVTLFWEHLARQTMHIDVWDGDSMLLIGSCSVELKYLFRGGNEAVQTTFEMDVLTSEYQEDSGALTGDVTRGGSIHPVGINSINRGRLHFRMANVGYPISKRKQEFLPVPSKTQVVVSQTAGNSAYKGGSLSSLIPAAGTKKVRVACAKHLAQNPEVASLLFSEQKKLESLKLGEDRDDDDDELIPKEGASEAHRKLARLKAVQAKQSGEQDNKASTIIGYRSEKTERTRDFKTMDIYRNQTKRDGIISMLNTSITTDHTIFPSFGTAEFFEFVVKNPFNHEETVTIEINDPELHLVTDAREWRHYKQLCRLSTPLEENMFTSLSSDKNKPQIFLRPKETVNIPLKYQSFKADHSVQPQGPTNPFDKKTCHTELDKSLEPRVVRVLLRSEAGKALAVLNVRVEPQPHVIDQTLRFYHPENCFMKKSVRLPPFHSLPGGAVGGSGVSQVFVRCSDSHVILDCKPTQPGEPHDVFMKVALGASPQIKRYFVCTYIDPFLSRPAQIWQCYVHALQRVDVTCVEGQSTHVSLLLRGTQASRVVKCYTSHTAELAVTPKDPFILAAGTVHELDITVRPLKTGSKFFYLNVVDPEYHQLIRSWLICAGCRSPIVSRAFELSLPVGGGGKQSSKRITYTNPYPVARKFHLLCDRNDLLQFKETVVEIGPGESHPIGLRFMPVMQPGTAEIMVFINDEEDKNEETFRVTANYKFV